MKRQMKDSGIEWIGQIPEEWHVSKIKNVYIVILGKMLSPSQTQKDQTLENYLCAANIKWSGVDTSIQKQMWFSESDKEEYKLHEGDILIIEGGLAGTSCKYRGEMAPCFIQNSVHCCRAKSNYSNQFLYYWMNVVYNSKYIENICNKATIQHYTKEKVMNTPFLICSSLEQEKIVSYLDRKCAQIDAIIAKQQQIIEKLKEYKLSVITEAVTKGLDPNVPMKDSGIDFIGSIPETWRICRLRNIGTLQNGISKGGEFFGHGFPFVSYGDVYRNFSLPVQVAGLIDSSDEERRNYSVESGDIFFTRTSETIEEVGFSSVCEETIPDATFAGFLIRVRPFTDDLVPKFAKYYFRSNHHRYYLVKQMNLVTRASLGQDLLKSMPVLVPPKDEQISIAAYLDKKCGAIESSIEYKQRVIERLIAYKKSLIYEVVTGKKEV